MTLPTNQRIATYLSTVEEWIGPEIAKALDIAPATAHVHVSRGINAVRLSEDFGPPQLYRSPFDVCTPTKLVGGGLGTRYGSSQRRINRLAALVALLVTVGLAGWIYPKLALGLGVLVA